MRGITTPMARLTPDTARIRALGGGGAMMMDALLPTVSIDTPLPDGAALLPAERTPYSMEHLWGQPSIMEEDLPDYAHGAAGGGGGGGRGRAPPPAPEPLLGSEGLRSARGRMFSQRGPSIIPGEPVRLEPTAEGLELEDEEANFSWAEALKRAAAPPPPRAPFAAAVGPPQNMARVQTGPGGAPGLRAYSYVAAGPATGPGNSKPSRPAARKAGKKQRKKRVVIKDPNRPKPKPWSEGELAHFRHLLAAEGPNNWTAKAAELGQLFGSARSAKSLHTRWLRDEGRIVDKPRGMAAMLQRQREEKEAERAAAAQQGA